MTIRAVVFDVGGVLERVDDAAWPQLWIARWERQMGLPVGHVISTLAETEPLGDVETGGMSESQLRDRYARALGLDDDQAGQMMAEMWDGYCGTLDRELYDFARGLRPAFATAILSNSADGARREEQRRFGFEDLVDVVIYSHEVGLAKPDPAVFRLTANRLGVEPQEVVLLDDNAGHVQAARACGWRAVLHRDSAGSIQQIRRILRQREVS